MILVGHIDCDCFYVSAERVRFPSLRGQPVGVLGNQGACVIAKSYELKAAGVTTAMPIWDAVKLCPQAIFIKRDFRWYEILSRKLLNLLKTVSPKVEYYSIDEMFFDADELAQAFGCPIQQAVEQLQQKVLNETGVPVSIGVSKSRTLAKLGSDAAKPFGYHVLLEDQAIEQFLKSQPVEEMSGIGKKSQEKLASHNIFNCHQFAQADFKFIRKLLTIKGETLWWELHGEPVTGIQTKRPSHKAISRGGSLGVATDDPNRLAGWAARNTERLVEELDYYQVFTKRLSLMLQYKDGSGWSGCITFPEPTARFSVLLAAVKQMLASANMNQRVSHMHLLAEKLRFRQTVQNILFQGNPSSPIDRVADIKQQINKKMGRFALRSAETLHLPDVYDDQTNQYDICDVHGKMCF
jgi:nucleotidyltransferase/DNA polymerase involved in DNA repair